MNKLSLSSFYSFEVLMYRVNKDEQELLQQRRVSNVSLDVGFVTDFTVHKLEDIGMHVRFVIIDTSKYMPGMKPLALLAWPNNGSQPVTLRYGFNTSNNGILKRLQFDIEKFKSCVFEFEVAHMKSHGLY